MKISKVFICICATSSLLFAVVLGGVLTHNVFVALLGTVFTVTKVEIDSIVNIMACFFCITTFTGYCILVLSVYTEQNRSNYIIF